jgi:hypothetical protein
MDKINFFDPDKRIVAAVIIISTLFLPQIVFWFSIVSLAFGNGLYVLREDKRKLALLIVIISLVLMPISYFLGFELAKTAFGQTIIETTSGLIK